jgi:hypothetical protein
MSDERPQNWVFLGDSLTEGVGSSRVSYVTMMMDILRECESGKPAHEKRSIHEFRLRPEGYSRWVKFNIAGFWDRQTNAGGESLWLWNLGCEGRIIETDAEWMPLIENLKPQKVFILRGCFESVIRPAVLHSGNWPWWIPIAWRGYAAMDPRCYFSTSSLRRFKQRLIDCTKQMLRKKLLAACRGGPLMQVDEIKFNLMKTVAWMKNLGSQVYLLELPPISEVHFPGSQVQFQRVNTMLRELAMDTGSVNIGFDLLQPDDFYLDGFHPNSQGYLKMALSVLKLCN